MTIRKRLNIESLFFAKKITILNKNAQLKFYIAQIRIISVQIENQLSFY